MSGRDPAAGDDPFDGAAEPEAGEPIEEDRPSDADSHVPSAAAFEPVDAPGEDGRGRG